MYSTWEGGLAMLSCATSYDFFQHFINQSAWVQHVQHDGVFFKRTHVRISGETKC